MNKLLNYIFVFCTLFFRKGVKAIFFSMIDSRTIFEGSNFVGRYSIIHHSFIGRGTYIGNNCFLCRCHIGRFCSIAQSVKVIQGKHPSSVFVSTHPIFYSLLTPIGRGFVKEQLYDEFIIHKDGYSIKIGNDVWIGTDVHVLEGVSIGNGAIIAAKSFVNKDVPPYAIVGGIPAKIIKYRFSEEEISRLQKIEWWNWEIDKIESNAFKFNNIATFIESFEDEVL